jgi:diguanylate cyclase (GGDEF)-like protein
MFFNKELERLDVQRNLPLSIVVTDLNGLKSINDNYGHKMGDKLIKSFADLLKEHCRNDDIICRWGVDEFALLFPSTSASKTEEIISRIKEKVKQTTCEGVQLSSAVGYAVKTNPQEDIEQIFNRADNNMYQHKAKQKKRD